MKKNNNFDINIPPLTKEEYLKRPIVQKQKRNKIEGNTCGNEFMSTKKKTKMLSRCWTEGSCDDPSIRMNFTSRFNQYVKVSPLKIINFLQASLASFHV